MNTEDLPEVLTTAQVAKLFNVDPNTVTKWAAAGAVPCFRTRKARRS